MTERIVQWIAQHLCKDQNPDQRGNMLRNLQNQRDILEAALFQDIDHLVMVYAMENTDEIVLIENLEQLPKQIIDYMCDEMFKQELEQINTSH